MDDTVIAESSTLIALERETARGVRGPAMEYLAFHASQRFVITPVIAGELAAGRSLAERARWETFLQPFRSLYALTPAAGEARAGLCHTRFGCGGSCAKALSAQDGAARPQFAASAQHRRPAARNAADVSASRRRKTGTTTTTRVSSPSRCT